jgi:hypothetical protein
MSGKIVKSRVALQLGHCGKSQWQSEREIHANQMGTCTYPVFSACGPACSQVQGSPGMQL